MRENDSKSSSLGFFWFWDLVSWTWTTMRIFQRMSSWRPWPLWASRVKKWRTSSAGHGKDRLWCKTSRFDPDKSGFLDKEDSQNHSKPANFSCFRTCFWFLDMKLEEFFAYAAKGTSDVRGVNWFLSFLFCAELHAMLKRGMMEAEDTEETILKALSLWKLDSF